MIDTDRMESQPLDGGYKCKKDPHSDANHLFYHTQYTLYTVTYLQIFEKCQANNESKLNPLPKWISDYVLHWCHFQSKWRNYAGNFNYSIIFVHFIIFASCPCMYREYYHTQYNTYIYIYYTVYYCNIEKNIPFLNKIIWINTKYITITVP